MLHFILGGQSSGKTRHGLMVSENYAATNQSLTYIATAIIGLADKEMNDKALAHQKERALRKKKWHTIEESFELAPTIEKTNGVLLIDSLTLWLFNITQHEKNVAMAIDGLLTAIKHNPDKKIIIISDEINFAPISPDQTTRHFCKTLGSLHQAIAHIAHLVELMVAGLPLTIKHNPA
ncbi:MAG: bifunctional adenosylcobinamide kinase/adenosylcobinamide-phosphate guanylyltransferase [Alphaproteobacteria bacterium]